MNKIDISDSFDYSTLVRINPKQSTLPIDTASEWSKAFLLVNKLIYELAKDTYTEEWEDELGETHRRTHIHPQLLPFLQERRRLQEQIWKISGGEAVIEGKKELFKKQADLIFQMSQDHEFKEKHEKLAKKIIEAEVFEE